MTEQEMIDRIAGVCRKNLRGDSSETWGAQIIHLIKEALPELTKTAGYVKLAEDQTFPPVRQGISTMAISYQQAAQDDMFNAGWRKVELEEIKCQN